MSIRSYDNGCTIITHIIWIYTILYENLFVQHCSLSALLSKAAPLPKKMKKKG
jgi:hypothetical protein